LQKKETTGSWQLNSNRKNHKAI